jgi:hypothetical protein
MAKLIVPTKALCLVQNINKSKKKYHLLKQNGMWAGEITVCGYCLISDHDLTKEEEEKTWKNIFDIKKEDLCQKCLGAIKAED